MNLDYWQKQTDKPLFPDIIWNKPEQKSMAGRAAIIGGHAGGFAAVAHAYEVIRETGIGQARAILPASVKRAVPASLDTLFVDSNISGGFSKDALSDFSAACSWADICLLIGDTGRNPETAMVFEHLVRNSDGQLVITRDAVDLLKQTNLALCERPATTLIISLGQLQKLFQSIYYPRVITFSMQLLQLIETLHKFTISYPCTIVTLHNEKIIMAHDGQVVTADAGNPMQIWRGTTAAKAAAFLAWTPNKPLQAISSSLINAF